MICGPIYCWLPLLPLPLMAAHADDSLCATEERDATGTEIKRERSARKRERGERVIGDHAIALLSVLFLNSSSPIPPLEAHLRAAITSIDLYYL